MAKHVAVAALDAQHPSRGRAPQIDPEIGEYAEPTVLAQYSDVPEMK